MGNSPDKEKSIKSPEPNSPISYSESPSVNTSFSRAASKRKSYKSQRSFGPPSFNPELRLYHSDELEEDIYDTGCSRMLYLPVKQVVGLRLVMHLTSKAHYLIMKEELVSQVEIDFGNYFSFYDTVFLLFRMEQLSYLSLKFSDPVNSKQLISALECVARMTLKLLKIQFLNSKSVTQMSFNKMNEINANFEYITGFSVDFFNCPYLTDICLSYIQPLIFTMIDLTKLEFSIHDCPKITEKGLSAFTQGMSQMNKLKEFKYECSEIRGIGNKFVEIFNENFKAFTSLTDLELKLPGFSKKFQDINYRTLIDTIETFQNLRTLALDFSYSKINKAIIDIKTLLRKLNPLEKLSIELNRCQEITGDTLIELFEGLKKQTRLFDFKMSLRACKALNPDILKHFEEALSSMGGILKLSLDFSECPDFSDRALKYVTSGIQKLQYLETFELQMRNCNKISDLGFYYLCFALEHTPKIKKLNFSIPGMSLLTNLAIEYLNEGLRFLPDLESLALNMFDLKNITEDGYLVLSNCLEETSTIKVLMLTAELTTQEVATALINLATCAIPLRELDLVLITAEREDYAMEDDDLIFFIEKAKKLVGLRRVYLSVDRFKAGKVGPRMIQDELYQVIECTVDCNILKDPYASAVSQNAL